MALSVRVGSVSDRDSTVIAGNSEPFSVGGDATRALRVWHLGERRGSSTSGLLSAVGDLDGLLVRAGGWVPEHDLVVVTRGHDLAIAAVGKTPDLTIGVRLHDVFDSTVLAFDADSTVTLSNDKRASVAVNGTNERWEFRGLQDLVSASVDHMDLAVLGAGEEFAFGKSHGADETLMEVHALLAGAAIIATPDVDLSVGAARVAGAVGVPSSASERGLLVGAEETLLLVARGVTSLPEVHVLDTGSRESLAAWLFVPANVMDLVGVTLLLHDLVARVVEDVDLMLVVEIDGSNPAITVDCDSSDTTGALGDLDSLLLLSGACVPGEDGRLGADLTGNSGLALRADTDAHNIIGVMLHVIGNVLGSGLDLTATEEFLGVGCWVKNDTEGSSHVDSLVIAVEVDVLLAVSATVAVDVLEIVLSSGLVVVDWVVLIGFDDLSEPGANGHELLTLSLLDLEEVIFSGVVVLATIGIASLTGLFIIDLAAAVSGEVGVVGKLAWCRSS